MMPWDKGRIFMKNKEIRIRSPRQAMRHGIGYLPEDRQKQGLVLPWAIGRNITLSTLEKISRRGTVNTRKELEIAKTLAEKVNVKAKSVFDLVSSLSGGNQQKVVFAKLLTADLEVLILDEPTKGVDVGAKSAIYEIISDLAGSGYGIILVSSEMPEIIGMCDRVAVMREGRITAMLNRGELTQETILAAAMDDVPITEGQRRANA
jgi:rhamnose transport system ATP-binding protein